MTEATKEFCECERFPKWSRLYQLCTGTAKGVTRKDCNDFRSTEGLAPIGEPQEEWTIKMKSRGLGDTIAKLTHYTGISAAVGAVAGAIGVDCGCHGDDGRQGTINGIFPYKG